MTLPSGVAEPVRQALERHGLGSRIERATEVGGGCINHGVRLETDRGAVLFLKWNASAAPGMFAAEADGLEALAAPGAVRVPEALAWSGEVDEEADRTGPAWLLLEHVTPGTASPRTEERLGRGLAQVHASRPAAHRFGWDRDNWIGSLPQSNAPAERWADFWREGRVVPQLEAARRNGHLADATLDRLIDLIPDALTDVQTPELVHGDLWGGNWFASGEGEPVLIDPAVYLGDGEVDLAMSELFGGFGPRFYDAYAEVRPVSDAYAEYRRDLYQLYYLLVHVNLFGASYEAGSLRAARRVVAALGG